MPSAVITLARAYWDICIFRLGPQHLPRSGALLVITALANLCLSMLINRLQLDLPTALLVAALEFVVVAGLTGLLLLAFRHSARLTQTLTALMGTGAVIGTIVLVLLSVSPQLPQLLRVTVFLWNLLVMAHILRHALEVHLVAGFVIAVGYAMVLIQLIAVTDRALSGAA